MRRVPDQRITGRRVFKNPFKGLWRAFTSLLTTKSWGELHSFFDTITSGEEGGKKTIASQLAEYRSWIYVAVSVIYKRVEAVEHKYYRNDTHEEIKPNTPEHDVIDKVFKTPNPYMSYRFMKSYWQLQLDLTGMAFGLVFVDGLGIPEEIYPMNVSDFVEVKRGNVMKNGVPIPVITGFTFKIDSEDMTFNPENVLYFHYPHPLDPRIGCSPVEREAYTVDVDHYIEAYERDFFRNSARPDFLLTYPEGIEIGSEEEADRIKAQWYKSFSGEGQFHSMGLLDQGGDIKTLTPKNKDLDLMFLANWAADKLFAAYNVPPGKVGMVKDVNRANAVGIDITFNSECIKPRLDLHDDVMNRRVLSLFDPPKKRIYMKHCNPIPRDREQDISEIEKKVQVPMWTPNEAREREGMEPIEGGDTLFIPSNYTSVAMALNPPEPPVKPAKPPTPPPSKEVEEVVEEVITKETDEYSEKWKDKRWEKFKIYTEGWERIWISRLKELFTEQMDEVLNNLNNYGVKLYWPFLMKEELVVSFEARWKILHDKYNGWSAKKMAASLKESGELEELVCNLANDDLITLAVEGLLKDIMVDDIVILLITLVEQKQTEAVEALLFDWEGNSEKFTREGRALSEKVMAESGQEELNMLGVDMDFDLENPMAREFLGTKVQQFSRDVLSSKANKLNKVLTNGFTAGESIQQLSDRVRGVYGSAIEGKYDALRIARTETIAASNAGAFIAYDQSGVVEEKGWLAVRDKRTRGATSDDKCDHYTMEASNGRVPYDKPFIDPRSGDRLLFPGDTSQGASGASIILCRCTLMPYTTRSRKNMKGPSMRELRAFRTEYGFEHTDYGVVRHELEKCYV